MKDEENTPDERDNPLGMTPDEMSRLADWKLAQTKVAIRRHRLSSALVFLVVAFVLVLVISLFSQDPMPDLATFFAKTVGLAFLLWFVYTVVTALFYKKAMRDGRRMALSLMKETAMNRGRDPRQ